MGSISYDRIEKLKDILKEKGYKLTPQRRAIVEVIIKNEDEHLTTEEIYNLVKEQCPEIGLATVYRTVMLLEEISVLTRLDLGDGCNRYELIHEEENHHHHHLICNVCGKVIEVEDDLLDSLEESIQKKYKFKIKNHSVKFYGECNGCSNKLKN